MYPKNQAIPLVVLTMLVGAAGAVLVCDFQARPQQQETAKEFQQLVGGLGFGPAVDLSRCAFSFDPRR